MVGKTISHYKVIEKFGQWGKVTSRTCRGPAAGKVTIEACFS